MSKRWIYWCVAYLTDDVHGYGRLAYNTEHLLYTDDLHNIAASDDMFGVI